MTTPSSTRRRAARAHRGLAEGEQAILEVRDTGIGIPASSLPFVFDRFYRADKARSRESGGIGLGLSIVKSICTAHGGTVAVTSAEGEGTRLRVALPLLRLTRAQQDAIEPAPGVPAEVIDV